MFDHLFNRYLERNSQYKKMKQKVRFLEDELKKRTKTDNPKTQAEPKQPIHQPAYMFPPHITINVNRKDESSPYKPSQEEGIGKRTPPVHQRRRVSSVRPRQTTNKPVTQPAPFPTHIEFLNVEKIVIERYEQSNNFGALGIKSLEGKLNIGANYGDKAELSDEVKEKLTEHIESAKSFKTVNKKNPPHSSEDPSKDPQDILGEFEKTGIWDDLFNHQPIHAENNHEKEEGGQPHD
ncbi:hypothetical protein PU629_08285 [Pullulanibacillus sp. KACC 23026]|uniref:hypothetical protein n=1 Tax=Pullulanibacillus sp. KACC 23026 TaxID=3028315 RepID=UPI0023AE9A3D|nr:hypothetical protein [Pullulanibacillus sp. KACC 23026]WEG14345.1 hypothetical protein PU629_08285 [Pullulanibacillus sp. KACC 23026]